MASSSVSQESLDMDDVDTARRSRVKVHRGYGGRGSLPHRGLQDKAMFGDGCQDRDTKDHQNGDAGGDGGMPQHSQLPGDRESPTRGAAARLKDKRNRPSHVKGKLPKDKRKLREKRRSTGVVHLLPSTESTGDSVDDEDDDDDEDPIHDTKKNTQYNESPVPGLHHQAVHEIKHLANPPLSYQQGNKSFEDSQICDSSVRNSETNFIATGRSESSGMSQNCLNRQPTGFSAGKESRFGGGGYISKYSTDSKFHVGNIQGDSDSSRTNTSSVLSRYREVESSRPAFSTIKSNTGAGPDSERKFGTTTTSDYNQSPQVQSRPLGFSVFNSNNVSTQRSDKPSYSSYVSSAAKFKDRDTGANGGVSVHSRLAGYQTPRPYTAAAASSSSYQQQSDIVTQLEKQLEKEKQENCRLQQTVEEKDKKIVELQKEIELLNKECDELDADNIQLQEENKALIRAMSKLTSSV